MGVQKEDVEKFLNGNPAFAKQYFAKNMSAASISKASGLPEKLIDFSQFQELSQVNISLFHYLFITVKTKENQSRLLTTPCHELPHISLSMYNVTSGKLLYLL